MNLVNLNLNSQLPLDVLKMINSYTDCPRLFHAEYKKKTRFLGIDVNNSHQPHNVDPKIRRYKGLWLCV